MLGKKAKDKITGFEGIITAKVEYLNGCVQYCIKPKAMIDGKMPAGEYIDEGQIEVIKDAIEHNPKKVGGPQSDCPKY